MVIPVRNPSNSSSLRSLRKQYPIITTLINAYAKYSQCMLLCSHEKWDPLLVITMLNSIEPPNLSRSPSQSLFVNNHMWSRFFYFSVRLYVVLQSPFKGTLTRSTYLVNRCLLWHSNSSMALHAKIYLHWPCIVNECIHPNLMDSFNGLGGLESHLEFHNPQSHINAEFSQEGHTMCQLSGLEWCTHWFGTTAY